MLPLRLPHALLLATAAAATLGARTTHAHFVLQSPPAMYEQNGLGDPQKAPPCGDNGGAVSTGMVTAYQAGEMITITIDETIYHPGHYRVSIAPNDVSELPDEPPVTPNNTDCGTAPIMDPPVYPVLADGVFLHDASFSEPQTIEIPAPDIACDNCILQVIQFMSNHGLNNPGGCYYHHCANIAITPSMSPGSSSSADESGGETAAPGETTAPGETSGDPVTSTSPTSSASSPDETTGGGGTGGGSEDGGDSGGATNPSASDSAASAPVTTADTSPSDDDSGCSCTARGGDGLAALGLLGLLGLRRRRR